MENVLVVCYSYTGNSRRAAQFLCSHRGWPMGEISDVQARGSWRCVLDSLLRRQPEVRYRGPDPAAFDTVVLVSPIWMYRLAGPMRSFVAREKDALRHVAVVCTMNSGGASNAFAEIAHLLGPGAVIRAAAFTSRELEDGSGTTRLLELGEALQPASRSGAPAQEPAWTAPAG